MLLLSTSLFFTLSILPGLLSNPQESEKIHHNLDHHHHHHYHHHKESEKIHQNHDHHHHHHHLPHCKFFENTEPPSTHNFYEDCDVVIDSNGLMMDKLEHMDELVLAAKGIFELGVGKSLCVPDGTTIFQNNRGEEQKIANSGFKLRLVETKHSFPVTQKECRGQGYKEISPKNDNLFAWGGQDAAYKALHGHLKENSYNCDKLSRGFAAESINYFIGTSVNFKCIASADHVDLIAFDGGVKQQLALEVGFIDHDGKIQEHRIEIETSANPADHETTIKLASEHEYLKVSAYLDETLFNPFANQTLVLSSSGVIYDDPSKNINSVYSYDPSKKFHMKCNFDEEAAWNNIGGNDFNKGTIKDLKKASQYALFDDLHYQSDSLNGVIIGKNYSKSPFVRVEIDSVLSIFQTFSDELFVPEFSCKQNESTILCEINRIGSDDVEIDDDVDVDEGGDDDDLEHENEKDYDNYGEVTLSIYAHSHSKCKVLGSTTATVQKNNVLAIHFHGDQLSKGNQTDVTICSVYGICQSLVITKTKTMEDEDLVNDLEEEYEIDDEDEDDKMVENENDHLLHHQLHHHLIHHQDSNNGMMIFSIFVSIICTIILVVAVVMLVRKHKEKRELEKRVSDLQRYNRNMGSIMGQQISDQPIVFQTNDDNRAYQLKKAACASSINQLREFP